MSSNLELALCELRKVRHSIVIAEDRLWMACNKLAKEDEAKIMAIKTVRFFTYSLEECLRNLINEMEANEGSAAIEKRKEESEETGGDE